MTYRDLSSLMLDDNGKVKGSFTKTGLKDLIRLQHKEIKRLKDRIKRLL